MTPKRRSVRLHNLPLLALRTAAADVHFHRTLAREPRPLSWKRIGGLIRPNLRKPVFVIGAARTGTTFLGDSIGRIPEISYHHEPVATKLAAGQVHSSEWSNERGARFFRLVYGWLMRIHLDGDLRFAEKTPRNSTIVGFLVRNFPDARYVHIIRDGRAAALSQTKQPWLTSASRVEGDKKPTYEPGGNPYGPYARYWVEPERVEEFQSTSDIHRGIWAWKRLTELGIEGLKQAPPDSVLPLRYEELIAQPQEHAERILDFLEIRSPSSRAVLHAALGEARTSSAEAWRRELTEEQLAEIEREAGPLLRSLGYVD